MRFLFVFLGALMFTIGCASFNPATVGNAVRGHAAFPGLSIAVQNCVSDHPKVREQIVEPWNRLFDKWEAAGDLEPDASLVAALASATQDMAEAQTDAIFIEQTIIAAGLDCGEFVRTEWANIKATFTELKTAISQNQRAVLVIEWTTLIANIVQGRTGEVVRM